MYRSHLRRLFIGNDIANTQTWSLLNELRRYFTFHFLVPFAENNYNRIKAILKY